MRSDNAAGAPERITVDWDEKPRSSKIGTAWESDLGDHEYILATPTALAASPEVAKLIETTLAALRDPLVVHLNMVAGKIAKPLPSQLVHIYGEDVIRSAFAALTREAEARGMERAAEVNWSGGKDVADTAPPFLSDFQRGFVSGLDAMRDAIHAEAAAILEEPK